MHNLQQEFSEEFYFSKSSKSNNPESMSYDSQKSKFEASVQGEVSLSISHFYVQEFIDKLVNFFEDPQLHEPPRKYLKKPCTVTADKKPKDMMCTFM